MDFANFIINNILKFYDLIKNNITLDWIIKFSVLYLFIIWGAFIIWVVKDITNRTSNIFLQVLSILIIIIFTPIFWLPIYLLLRPRNTIFEKYYEDSEEVEFEENEINIMEDSSKDKEEFLCPHCFKHVDKDFSYCPYCKEKLTKVCEKCTREIKVYFLACPYCWLDEEKLDKNNISKKILSKKTKEPKSDL